MDYLTTELSKGNDFDVFRRESNLILPTENKFSDTSINNFFFTDININNKLNKQIKTELNDKVIQNIINKKKKVPYETEIDYQYSLNKVNCNNMFKDKNLISANKNRSHINLNILSKKSTLNKNTLLKSIVNCCSYQTGYSKNQEHQMESDVIKFNSKFYKDKDVIHKQVNTQEVKDNYFTKEEMAGIRSHKVPVIQISKYGKQYYITPTRDHILAKSQFIENINEVHSYDYRDIIAKMYGKEYTKDMYNSYYIGEENITLLKHDGLTDKEKIAEIKKRVEDAENEIRRKKEAEQYEKDRLKKLQEEELKQKAKNNKNTRQNFFEKLAERFHSGEMNGYENMSEQKADLLKKKTVEIFKIRTANLLKNMKL